MHSREIAVECKAFNLALQEINLQPEKVKKWLNDKRMTLLEKKIIEGHLLIRNNSNTEVVQAFSNVTDSHIEFVNAHKHLLLGIASNNLSHFENAKRHLEKAAALFLTLDPGHYLFSSHFYLFMLYSNLNDLPRMKQALDGMNSVKEKSRILKIRLMRCQFIYADESNDVNGAREWIKSISVIQEEMTEADLIAHLVSEFMFYAKLKEYDQAREILNQMKSHRKYHLTENFNFSRKLLDHLTLNAPIYAYDKDFKDVPILLHQLKVIQAMEANDPQEAKKYWGLLQKNYPQIYLDNFEYSGQKCLFSHCLEKHKAIKNPTRSIVDTQEGSKPETFLALLRASEAPLSSGYVYEVLWGAPPEQKEDLKRLTRLVSRVRAKYGVEIQSRKGNYFLEEKSEKKKIG